MSSLKGLEPPLCEAIPFICNQTNCSEPLFHLRACNINMYSAYNKLLKLSCLLPPLITN